ncbi:Leucine-rich repeat domain, L domain-like [Phytophthora cactorum]|nr:Leucine-rich repeat domain, L domain-like [Phytophthora cactorum]
MKRERSPSFPTLPSLNSSRSVAVCRPQQDHVMVHKRLRNSSSFNKSNVARNGNGHGAASNSYNYSSSVVCQQTPITPTSTSAAPPATLMQFADFYVDPSAVSPAEAVSLAEEMAADFYSEVSIMYDMLSDIKTPTAEGRAVDELMRRLHNVLSAHDNGRAAGGGNQSNADRQRARTLQRSHPRVYLPVPAILSRLRGAGGERAAGSKLAAPARLCGRVPHPGRSVCPQGLRPRRPDRRLLVIKRSTGGSSGYALACRTGMGGYTSLEQFTRSVEKISTLRVARLRAGERVGTMFSSMDALLGVQLVASSRRDFRVCVNFVLPGSDAETLGIHPAALVVAINGKSMRGVSLQRVLSTIRRALCANESRSDGTAIEVPELGEHIEIDLAQREHEMNVDRNPFALTQFPSPQGQHLPGVKQFRDDLELDKRQEPMQIQEQNSPSLGRQRSRSFKHFWMSDRSSKPAMSASSCSRSSEEDTIVALDESIERLRKQLVCHTCHRQLREGLQMELTGANFEEDPQKPASSPPSHTLLLMPQHIAEAMERSTSDASNYKQLDKSELFDKDEISDDMRVSEAPEKSRPPVLFSMFPKVQIVASAQHLAHQPHLHELTKESSKWACNHRWSEAEFKRLVAESNAQARLAGAFPPTSNALTTRPKALSASFDTPRFGNAVQWSPFGPSKLASKDVGILAMVGLSKDVHNESEDPERVLRKEAAVEQMSKDARDRIEERIFHLLDSSPAPDNGDLLDIMHYVRVQCLDGGRVQDSFFIDGVLVHKSLARKGMRSDILNPRILLIASALDYQRKKEAISSLESVAGQEVEYMHIVTEKILTLNPDIVMFEGHVHRVAEELLFKASVSVVKNVRLIDLQRIARCTGASVLTSYDHIDKMSDVGVIGTCKRFYVLLSDQEPKSAKKIAFRANADGFYVAEDGSAVSRQRKKRTQRQNIVFEGGITSKGCTLCLRGGTPDVFTEITSVLTAIIRAAYNMRLQRSMLAAYGYIAPCQNHERSVAEEWFAKSSTSLYISLKSNSLSMRAALKETQAMCKWCKAHTRFNNISSLRVVRGADDDDSSASSATVVQSGHPNWCTCGAKSSNCLRHRILFSTCWSTLEGKTASKADMMCIDFYSANDMSVGQFFDNFCFSSSKAEFKRAFSTSKLSFSHDTGRVIVRVKDLNDFKDSSDQLPPAEFLREFNYRAVLQQIRSEDVLMWSRNMSGGNHLSSEYAVVPSDLWNYSFGKFLEDMFYGKAMDVDCVRFPHLAGVSGSRDSSLVHYFSRHGRVVSVHVEPLEPVLHVALQPALWQEHIDHQVQLDAIHDLCDLVREVYGVTTSKVAESMADLVTPLHAKQNLKILRNEVQQWYSCFGAKIESNPPQDVFAYNAHFREIYEYAVGWSLRITRAVQATVKPTMASLIYSPKSALPKAWFDQLAQQAESSDRYSEPPTPSELEATPVNINFQEPGNLAHLASFARSLAAAKSASPAGGMAEVANEVANTLRQTGTTSSRQSEPWDTDESYDRYDESSHSFPADFKAETDSYPAAPVFKQSVSAMGVPGHVSSTMGALGSKKALENFRLTQQAKKPDGLGYLALPKRLLEWHPSLPLGANKANVLVNAKQPTSVVAYSLFSNEYSRCINENMKKEATRYALEAKTNGTSPPIDCDQSEETRSMLRILRSTTRNNVDHSFVDENQFQSVMRFSCKSYYAMQFHALRKLYYGGDRNYVESLCNCQQWNAAGGKSGAGFLKTRDERFIAKAIPEIELQMFLSMANEYFCYMAKTFENDLSSMLSKVLGIYKVSISKATQSGDSDQNVRMCVIVMENLMYGREVDFSFDLKGKMEGRYREGHNGDSRSVLWDRNFVELAGGIPLPLQESALSLLLSAIMNDTTFLASVQATDYSMLVGYDVNKQELVACIIDYIHKYDFMKMMEHAGKRLIQEEGEITVLNPKHYRKRFCLAMNKYFVTIPSRYTKVTTVVRNTASTTTVGSTGTTTQDDDKDRDYAQPPYSTSTTAKHDNVPEIQTKARTNWEQGDGTPPTGSSSPVHLTYWLRFEDVRIRNDRDLPLYVMISRGNEPALDDERSVHKLEASAQPLLLDCGPEGQWKGSHLPRMFEQELLVFDPLVFASVVIGKPASAKPPTAQMLVFAYGSFETYVRPTKSVEQVAQEMEALSNRFLQTVMEVEQDQLQGEEELSLDALQRNARQLFRMFDQDKSDSIDFEGCIDEREFVIAMYITKYLRAKQKSQKRDISKTSNSSQTLSPIDVFNQLDGDRDELLNAFEYEKALELLDIPLNTKLARKVARAKLPESATISLEQFKRAWVELVDVCAELQKRNIERFSGVISQKKGKKVVEKMQDALLDEIHREEQEELRAALDAKEVVVRLEKERRAAEQEESRRLFQQQRQAATSTRTEEALRERQDKINRKKDRMIRDRQAREERRLLDRAEVEAEKRLIHEREVVQELMTSKMERIIRRKARCGDDAVDLRGRGLKEFPHDLYHGRDALSSLSSLLILDLARNQLQSLPGAIFTHLFSLRSLDVSNNELSALPEEFGEARDLQLLDARRNRLTTTPKGLTNLHELRVLHLAYNRLTRFGDHCQGLYSLEELNLASNVLEVLADDIGDCLVKLARLNLRGNPTLKRLPNGLQQLRDLNIWDLSACDQKRLGKDVFGSQLQSLRSLNLSFNALSTLPDGVGALPKLQELNFKSNVLGSLPSAVGNLSELVILNGENNALQWLPSGCGEHWGLLEELRLSHNRLVVLPVTLGLLRSLRRLHLSNNHIPGLPLELGALTSLRELDVSWNQLTSIPDELGCLESLTTLDLSHNQLVRFPQTIAMLKRLTCLRCSHNALTTPLESGLGDLKSLRYVDLAGNCLVELEPCLYELPELDLYNNGLQALPLELADGILAQLDVLSIGRNPLTLLPEKTSSTWKLKDQYQTSFTNGYTPTEIKAWVTDNRVCYPVFVRVWEELMAEISTSQALPMLDENTGDCMKAGAVEVTVNKW